MATTTIAGVTWRVSPQGVTRRDGRRWAPVTRAELLALPLDGEVWAWLREHGITRPSPSGATQPEAERRAGQVLLRLSDDVRRRLDQLADAWGVTRSAAVGRLVDEETARSRR